MDLDNPTSLIATSTIHGLCGRLHSTLWLYLVIISWSWCLQYPGHSTATEAVHSPMASWTLPGVSKPATWCQTSGDSSMTPSILGVSGTSEATPLVAAPSFSLLLFIMALLCGFHEAQTSSHLGDSYMLPSLAARLRCSPGVFWTTASVRDS